MPYESPKQIRRRRQRAEDRPARKQRKADFRPITTDEQWDSICDFHVRQLNAWANQECADAAGRHARALVTMAVQRRAYQVMRELDLRSCWKAMDMARHELLNCEAA